MRENSIMVITLGDFDGWRIKRTLTFFGVMILPIFNLKFLDMPNDKLNMAIIFSALISVGILIESKIFKVRYVTYYSENNNVIHIRNKKINYRINRNDIINVYHREVLYGGKSLKVIGYKLIIVCKDKKYCLSSVYDENRRVEDSDLFKLEKAIKKKRACIEAI